MATIPVTPIPSDGVIGAMGATVAGGDAFAISEGDILEYFNGHSSSITVTFIAVAASVAQIGGFPAALSNKAFVVPAGEFLRIPVSGSTLKGFQNATTSLVNVTYTGHNAALKVGLYRK